MTRVIGPPKSKRRRWTFLWCLVIAVGVGMLFIPGALAVHEFQFQLDGDTSHTAAIGSAPYDWNDVFNVSQSGGIETVSVNSTNVGSGKTFDAANFVRDFETNATCPTTSAIGLNSTSTNLCTGDDTTYATGSKDTLGVGNGGWQCNHDNNVNSKIDIMNAYVLQWTNPVADANGVHHKIFYFGVERNVSNGTNDVGVWFLQSGASCSAPTGSVNFTGQHQDGDTLVVAEQTSGGGVSTAKAFRWAANAQFPGDSGCIDSNDNPNPKTGGCNNLPIATGADCKQASAGDSLCATTNAFCPVPRRGPAPPCTLPWNSAVTTQWLTADGSNVDHTISSPDFFEGGIDITAAFQGQGGTTPSCFSTSVPDTRSSASATATLFDFTVNQIGSCTSGTTTTPKYLSDPTGPTYSSIPSGGLTIPTQASQASGAAPIKVRDAAHIDVTGLTTSGSFGGSVNFYICGPLALDSTSNCVTGGVKTPGSPVTVSGSSGVADVNSDTLTLTSVGRYCWRAEYSGVTSAGIPASNDPAAGSTSTSECFTVNPVTATLSTSATCVDSSGNAASPCLLGDTLKDTATLGNTAYAPGTNGLTGSPTINATDTTNKAGGSISWTAYGPDSCSTTAMSATSRDVSGDGTYPTSTQTAVSFVPSSVGAYVFVATYGGNSPNTTAPTTAATCAAPGSGETVTVSGSVSTSSLQGWLPNDRITVTSTAGTTLSGSVTATLYYGAFTGTLDNCAIVTGAVDEYHQTFTSLGSTNSTTLVTTNSSFYVGHNPSDGTAGGPDTDATHSYFWLIHTNITGLSNPNDRCESATITHSDAP
jgi:hypothetical protein